MDLNIYNMFVGCLLLFFYWTPVAGAPVSTAAMMAYCMSLALEVPAFNARSTDVARDL
jgi:hypothetical protein